MMKFLYSFLILGVFLTASTAQAFEGRYQWNIHFPSNGWTLKGDQQDGAGYTKIYTPSDTPRAYPQNLSVLFNRGDHTPLKDAMQVVINQHQQVKSCGENSIHPLRSTSNMILYTTNLGQCSNGKSLFQVIKALNMPDGQYSIIYAVDPNVVSKSDIQTMKMAVMSATLQ